MPPVRMLVSAKFYVPNVITFPNISKILKNLFNLANKKIFNLNEKCMLEFEIKIFSFFPFFFNIHHRQKDKNATNSVLYHLVLHPYHLLQSGKKSLN